jgi:trimeric autotransporter adhesin
MVRVRMRGSALVRGVVCVALASYLCSFGPARAGSVGDDAKARGANATALGNGSAAGGDNSTAVGVLSRSSGANATAIGNLSTAHGDNSVAVGVLSRSSGANTTAIGNLSAARGDNSIAVGVLSRASGDNTTAVGNLSAASGPNGTAIGILGAARGANATAVGNQSAANGASSTAVGSQSLASGDDSVSFGTTSAARGWGSVVIGNGAMAFGANSIAIGNYSIAAAPNVVSFGSPGAERRIVNIAPGMLPTDAASYGQLASLAMSVEGRFALIDQRLNGTAAPGQTAGARIDAAFAAFGPGAGIERDASARIGNAALVSVAADRVGTAGLATIRRDGATSARTNAGGAGAVAPGVDATARTRIVAAGSGAANAVPFNSPTFGSRRSPPGGGRLASAPAGVAPSDAASYVQLQGVATGLQSQIAGLQAEIEDNRREARAGTALALASSGLHFDPRPGKASLAAAFGAYKGQSGLALGLGYAVSDRWRINAAFTGTPQVSDYGMVAGGSWTLN